MAVDNQGQSIAMTATADAVTRKVHIVGISFQGSGLTAGHRILLTNTAGGVIADYLVEAATDNADLWNGRPGAFHKGLLLTTNATGTWVLTVMVG